MLIFEPIEPIDGAGIDRVDVPDAEMSAQDPDLNFFLEKDRIKESQMSDFSLFGTMFAKAASVMKSMTEKTLMLSMMASTMRMKAENGMKILIQ